MDTNQQEPFVVEPDPIKAEFPPTENDRLLAALSYVSQIIIPAAMPIVLLLTPDTRDKSFIRHHAMHSLALLAAAVLYYVAAGMVLVVVSWILPPLACLGGLTLLVPAAAALYGGYKAFRGEFLDIPWVTDFLKRNGWV